MFCVFTETEKYLMAVCSVVFNNMTASAININVNQQGCQIRKTPCGESVRPKPKPDPHFLRTTQLVLTVYIFSHYIYYDRKQW